MKRVKVSEPASARYEKIALDIAYSIWKEEYKIGEVIKGRSTLSGKYGVSAETIRRAVKLLEEAEAVSVEERVGILVTSKEKAIEFIETYREQDKLLALREEIRILNEQKEQIDAQVNEKIEFMIEQATVMRNMGVITPLEAKVSPGSHLIGQTIGEVQFWRYTGATIIGINRMGQLILSPGPKLKFFEGDIILYVGNADDNISRVEDFIRD
ncbi:MAG TPA: GntR family transcriptional regulator [Tissierellia bacterium]|nr:GntR family transcriptional regulator [Tissierellia bacterium]